MSHSKINHDIFNEDESNSVFDKASGSMLECIWRDIIPSVVQSHLQDRQLAHNAATRVFARVDDATDAAYATL